MNTVIFGSNGQDGHYLSALLRSQAINVCGVPRGQLRGDLQTPNSIKWLLLEEKPDYIFHLAGNSTIQQDGAADNHAAVCNGTFNLLEAVRQHSPAARVFIAGSGYQFRNDGYPIRETDPWEPAGVYSAARCYANLLVRQYRKEGLKIWFGYLFHHDSPRRKIRHLAKRIGIAARSGTQIQIGDLCAVKEWTFAGDTVEAIWALVNQDAIFEANIGTGDGKSVQQFVEACFDVADRDWRNFIVPQEGFVPEYRSMTCDPTRIFSIGWRPKTALDRLAHIMVNFDE